MSDVLKRGETFYGCSHLPMILAMSVCHTCIQRRQKNWGNLRKQKQFWYVEGGLPTVLDGFGRRATKQLL
jgi:hypothetical protein